MARFLRAAALITTYAGLFLLIAFAQQRELGTVTVSVEHEGLSGGHLVDARGHALYALLVPDASTPAACSERCLEVWAPLLTRKLPHAGRGIDAAKLGALELADGSLQVTYNGLPLYTAVHEADLEEASAVEEIAFGGRWFLVNPSGEITAAVAPRRARGGS